MRVAVVGGSGFVGRHVVRRLCEGGARVTNVDRRAPTTGERDEVLVDADLAEAGELESAAKACGPLDGAVWLASTPNLHRAGVDASARDDVAIMVEAPLRFLAALDPRLPSFVYMSSIQVYGVPRSLPVTEDDATEPHEAYGVAKLTAEHFLRISCAASLTALALFRAAFVFGPGQHARNVIPIFLDALRRGEPLELHGSGSEIRDDVYVGDVAAAVERALVRRVRGTFNLASARPVTVRELAEACCRAAGRSIPFRNVERHAPQVDRWFSNERATSTLEIEWTSLDEGLAAMWREVSAR